MQSLDSYFKNPRKALIGFLFCTDRLWPDKFYISALFRLVFRKKLDWDNPKSFCEMLNWRKLNDHNDRYTLMADKFAVKEYVAECIGKEHVVDNYGVYDHWDEICFDALPNQFVIKCTHDSGGAFVCRDKTSFDFEKTRRIVEKNLKRNYYYHLREWPYLNIKPRIIIDRYLDDGTGNELRDYKWWCFHGEPKYMYCTIKGDGIYENFYDMNFLPVMINHGFPRHQPEFERPASFELMKELAAKLSRGIPFVRIDFFEVEGSVFFGEFTFYDWGGMKPFEGDWDNCLGELLKTKQEDTVE